MLSTMRMLGKNPTHGWTPMLFTKHIFFCSSPWIISVAAVYLLLQFGGGGGGGEVGGLHIN